jgi:hypothetical protein
MTRPSRRARGTGRRGPRRVDFESVRRLALALPGAEEGTSYRTPAFRVRGVLFARLLEDGESIVVKADLDERETLMAADPETFFITDHYRDHPMLLVRLSTVRLPELRELLEQSWRRSAPRRLVAELDGSA